MEVTLANYALTVLSMIARNLGIPSSLPFSSVSAQQIPLDQEPEALYVRRERKDRQRVINVFDQNGSKAYTIERKTQMSPIWSLLESPSRKEIATIHAGLRDRSVDFHYKPGVQHRELKSSGGLSGNRRFYLNDGACYEWIRASKYLERVSNPGGGDEEIRERVAKARLMRQFRFDYELLIDTNKIDRDVALATAFALMVTQWGLSNTTGTRGPTLIPKQLLGKNGEHEEYEQLEEHQQPIEVENRVFLVLERPDGSRETKELAMLNREAYLPGEKEPLRLAPASATNNCSTAENIPECAHDM